MNDIKRNIRKAYRYYKQYRLFVLIINILVAFIIGAFVFSPFIETETYQWIKELRNTNELVAALIDPEYMFIDSFIASTTPLFFAWACVMFLYFAFAEKIRKINQITKYFNFLTKGPGYLILMLGSLICGMAFYGCLIDGINKIYIVVLGVGIYFITLGSIFRMAGGLQLKRSAFLDKYACHVGIVCLLLGIASYLYGVISDPIKTYKIIKHFHSLS